jgi:AraC-like DNA-binding protein
VNILIDTYSIQPVNLVQAVFIGICIFGTVLLFYMPRFRGLCLLLSLEVLLMAFNFSEETKLFGQAYLVTPVFTLCIGPAFYLFVRHLVVAKLSWTTNDMIHFAPAIILLPFTNLSSVVIALGSLSLISYGCAAYLWLRKYSQLSQANSSAAIDMRLTWLVRLMCIFAALGLTDIIRLNLQSQLGYAINSTWYFLHQACVMLVYATLIFNAIRQPLLFDGLEQQFDEIETKDNDHLTIKLFEQLHSKIVDNQMFKQPRLSLNDLAKEFGLGTKDISNAINQGANQNLCEYINGLRIEEVKKRIARAKETKLNLLEIGLAAGFNSKSSFNVAFKSNTGLNPSQYHQSLLESKNIY